jgi:hypothetical protein
MVLFLLFTLAIVLIQDKWGPQATIRWGGLAGFTLVLFGLFVADSERALRTRRFWALFSVLAAGHLAGFAIVLTRAHEWKLSWFMAVALEYPLFLLFRRLFVLPGLKGAVREERG